MLTLLKKIFYHPRYGQFMRFAFIGGTCMIVELVLLYAFITLTGKGEDKLYVVIFNSIAFSVALTLNYIVSRYWVFERGRYSVGKEFLAFATVGAIALALSNGLILLAMNWFRWEWLLAKIFSVCLVLIWNFIMKKFFIFKR